MSVRTSRRSGRTSGVVGVHQDRMSSENVARLLRRHERLLVTSSALAWPSWTFITLRILAGDLRSMCGTDPAMKATRSPASGPSLHALRA